MKKHTDSQHIYHLKNEGTGCYGIMLKQRDYYIYAYLPDTEVFHNLPLNVAGVIFIYLNTCTRKRYAEHPHHRKASSLYHGSQYAGR